MVKIAVLGMNEPRYIPGKNWKLYGLGLDHMYPHFSKVFEMHTLKHLEEGRGKDYIEKLKEMDNLVMRDSLIPGCEIFPFKEAEPIGDYYTSSGAYMLTYAILQNPEEIYLDGFSLTENYGNQRACLEYLIGFAKGKGINVTFPEDSPFLKIDDTNRDGCIERYGDQHFFNP